MPEKCQHMECDADAEFEILDMADLDPYTCTAFSCTDHVGDLLGHALHVAEDAPQLWEVRPYGIGPQS